MNSGSTLPRKVTKIISWWTTKYKLARAKVTFSLVFLLLNFTVRFFLFPFFYRSLSLPKLSPVKSLRRQKTRNQLLRKWWRLPTQKSSILNPMISSWFSTTNWVLVSLWTSVCNSRSPLFEGSLVAKSRSDEVSERRWARDLAVGIRGEFWRDSDFSVSLTLHSDKCSNFLKCVRHQKHSEIDLSTCILWHGGIQIFHVQPMRSNNEEFIYAWAMDVFHKWQNLQLSIWIFLFIPVYFDRVFLSKAAKLMIILPWRTILWMDFPVFYSVNK